MSRLNRIRKDAPELLENPEVVDLVAQADQMQDLKAVADTPGGKQLVKLLLTDVVSAVNRLESSYKTATHTELIAICAQLSSSLTLAKLLLRSKENMELLDKELENVLSE